VKIELTEAEADTGLHHHSELWVRVLSSDPLDPSSNLPDIIAKRIAPEVLGKYFTTACAWHEGLWEDDDPERSEFGFEQWWILPSKRSQ